MAEIDHNLEGGASAPVDDYTQPMINPSRGTVLMCTGCGTLDAAHFYIKRRRGLYALLCFRNGEGCWERSARTLCSYVDDMQMQCTQLAEYEVVSADGENSRHTCTFHLSQVIPPGAPQMLVFPLED